MSTVSAIVLAAGLSSRMGAENKLLLPVDGKPMVRVVVERLLEAGVEEVLVVTGYEVERIQEALSSLPVKMIFNPNYRRGMTSSIQTGVAAASGLGYMICPGDMPFLQSADYRQMRAFFGEKHREDAACICAPVYQGKRGHPVVFAAHYREEILQHKEPEGCKGIVGAHHDHLYTLPFSTSSILRDMDTPEDYGLL